MAVVRVAQRCSAEKVVWAGNAPKNSHFPQHFNLVYNSVVNDEFTFIALALQMKTWQSLGMCSRTTTLLGWQLSWWRYSGWLLSRWQFSWVAIVLGGILGETCPERQLSRVAIVLSGSCAGGSCPRWHFSRWQLSWVAFVRVAVFLCVDCPRWQLSGWRLSCVAVVQVVVVRMHLKI